MPVLGISLLLVYHDFLIRDFAPQAKPAGRKKMAESEVFHEEVLRKNGVWLSPPPVAVDWQWENLLAHCGTKACLAVISDEYAQIVDKLRYVLVGVGGMAFFLLLPFLDGENPLALSQLPVFAFPAGLFGLTLIWFRHKKSTALSLFPLYFHRQR